MPKLSFRLLMGVLTRRRKMRNPEHEEENENEEQEGEETNRDEDGVGVGDGDGDGDGDADGDGDGEGDADGNGDGEEAEVVALPQADLFLSVVYPPAQYIKDNNPGTIERIIKGPKRGCLHGLWETKGVPEPYQNKIDKDEVKDYELAPALRNRIEEVMPQMSDMTSEQHLKKEFNKHGKHLLFLPTVPEYITFALDVYERYRFVDLLGFVADRIEEEGIGQAVQFYGMPWVSVRLGDLLRIVQSFPPICRFRDAVGVQLLKRGGQHVFYEICMNFTEDQSPAMRCRKTPEAYVNGKREEEAHLSRDLRVVIIA